MEASIYVTSRIRKSPFFERTLAAGATQVSVYNKTYLVGGYASMESEFWSLVNDVTLWDVTCQRVVEIAGPDAFAFTDLLTPRDLSACGVGQCRYVLITNQDGGIEMRVVIGDDQARSLGQQATPPIADADDPVQHGAGEPDMEGVERQVA